MATYTIHQIPTSRAAIATDELEVQATGGGQSARVTAASLAALGGPTGPAGATGATGASGPTGAPGGPDVWNSGTTYATGDLVIDRGGIWQATGASTNSEPVSGNTDWTLVGGLGYVTPTPLLIPGCVLWLDASDATTINAGSPVDDDLVSAWTDKSVAGNDAAQATADNKPVYKTNIQNGLSVLRFDPSVTNRFMELPVDLFRNLDAFTVAVAVSVPDATSTGSVLYASRADGTYARVEIGIVMPFAKAPDAALVAASMAAPWTLPANIPLSTVCVADCAGTGIVFADPAELFSTFSNATFFDPPAALSDSDSTKVQIGGTEAGHELTADIYEIVKYDRALNIVERQQLLDYLCSKWATLL